jgi:ABC-type sugar transport system permease subunit
MKRDRDRFPSKYLMPLIILAALVWAIPLLYSLCLAFTDASPGSAGRFVGFANFQRAFHDERFVHAFLVSIVFATGAVIFNIAAGLIIAVALRRHPRQRAIAQAALFIPWALSELAVALIWRGFLDENTGLVNAFLGWIGRPGLPWRTDGFWAMSSLWIATAWQGLAFSTMLQMAGLASLPENLIHAAKLDGAGRAAILRAVVWPHLRRVLAVNALLVFLMSMVNFSLPFALTGGGPIFATELAALYSFRTAFTGRFEFGYAAAQGMLVLFIYGALTAALLRLRRKSP